MSTVSAATDSGCSFVIARIFDAPRAMVFEAWTEPQRLAQWWGPHHFTNPVCQLDVRPGGKYRVVMRGPNGPEYPLSGEYQEVVEPERLAMSVDCSEHSSDWHDLVNANGGTGKQNAAGVVLQTVTFENLDGKTKLTIRMRFESSGVRDAMMKTGMNEGWSGSLERLAEHLARSA